MKSFLFSALLLAPALVLAQAAPAKSAKSAKPAAKAQSSKTSAKAAPKKVVVAKAAARISLGRAPKGQGRRSSKVASTTLAEASTPAAEVNGEPVPADVSAGAGVPDVSATPDGWPA